MRRKTDLESTSLVGEASLECQLLTHDEALCRTVANNTPEMDRLSGSQNGRRARVALYEMLTSSQCFTILDLESSTHPFGDGYDGTQAV